MCGDMLLPIKLKCFFTFYLIAWIQTSDKIWLVISVESMLANFVDLLDSSGRSILSVSSFVEYSSFIAAGIDFLFAISRLIFVCSFASMWRVLCALLTAIPTFPKIISREFVLVGFVSHLSVLFFWNFKNVPQSHLWSAAHRPPMNHCVLMAPSLKASTLHSLEKSLGFKIPIPAVACRSFLPFPAHVLCPLGAVASTVALDLPTRSTWIRFPNVSVSVMKEVRKFVCVLHVWIRSRMTRRFRPQQRFWGK